MSAGLAASTVTPGRTAPDVSRTTPVMLLCAHAGADRSRNDDTTTRHGIHRDFIIPLPSRLINQFALHPCDRGPRSGGPPLILDVVDQRSPSGVSRAGRLPASRARICAPFTTLMRP